MSKVQCWQPFGSRRGTEYTDTLFGGFTFAAKILEKVLYEKVSYWSCRCGTRICRQLPDGPRSLQQNPARCTPGHRNPRHQRSHGHPGQGDPGPDHPKGDMHCCCAKPEEGGLRSRWRLWPGRRELPDSSWLE